MLLSAGEQFLRACSCAPPKAPCETYWTTPIVFLGTVTEAIETSGGRAVRARMRVDRAYKGVTEETLELFDDGMCDGPILQPGEQYLMYTRRFGNGALPVRGCTRSRHVKYAKEDLEYLNGLADAEAKSSIFGKVLDRTDDYYGDEKPLPGAMVAVSGPMGKLTALSDANGQYSFAGLEPAEYTVSVNQPGYYRLSAERTRRLEARGCAEMDFVLRKERKGSIRGRVLRASGEPSQSGLRIDLVRMAVRNGREIWNTIYELSGTTNSNGEFQIDRIPPGKYKVGLNLYQYPTARAPYPTIYWPQQRAEESAEIVEITDETSMNGIDFRLPPEPRSGVIKGIVFSPKGTPAANVTVQIEALPNNGSSPTDENRKKTDAGGGFLFEVLEGFEYEVRAWSALWTDSPKVKFSLSEGPAFVTLILEEHGPPKFTGTP